MARRKDIDGSAGVPTFYGKELRYQRELAGLTLQQLVEGSFFGQSHLSEIERGERRMPPELAEHVDKVLKTDGFFSRCCEDVRRAKNKGHADYYAAILELEERAQDVEEWAPDLIPGALQLEPYIRAVIRQAYPCAPEEQVAEKLSARQERAWLYQHPKSPENWLIMSELVLRRPLLDPDEMAEQLAHLLDVSRHHRFIPQILPWNAGVHPFTMGMTKILSFSDAPPLVYTEGMYSGHIIDDPGIVRQYAKAYDRLRAAALSPKASLKLIEQAAEDYRNGKQSPGLERSSLAQEQPQQW
ncbi:helix-turn-helix transcriptional regulator [Streptomyces sp. NPDC021749]|uniref:helix-turn-helix domain-containing protein n=1 Tax=Streptomyces sp. NPDC021749 TaxID=3154905 RepID=UPI003402DE85